MSVFIGKGKGMKFVEKTSSQIPQNIDYNLLSETTNNVKDLRKKSSSILEQIPESKKVEELTRDSVIPIPGMLIQYENSQSDTPPHPSEGPTVPSGGLNWSDQY